MKEMAKSIAVGVIVLVLALGIFYFIFAPYFRSSVSNQFSFGGADKLDVVKNPARYEGKEITLKNAYIKTTFPNPVTGESGGPVIAVQESDGNFIELKYYYYRDIFCGGKADLTGKVMNTVQAPEGLVPVNLDGSPRVGTYYFNVTEVKCRN